jgi:sec-independent protein translocase protein TatA
MFGLSPSELAVIALIVLLIFGARRLPEIGKGLGDAIREFKKVKKEMAPEERPDSSKEDGTEAKKAPKSIEAGIADKVLEQVPGVKQAMAVKKKADKIKEILL